MNKCDDREVGCYFLRGKSIEEARICSRLEFALKNDSFDGHARINIYLPQINILIYYNKHLFR